jgi:hypothetical protein
VAAHAGGLVGPLAKSDLSEELQKAISGLKTGGVTPVLRTARGYQIIKIENLSDTTTKPFDEARDRPHSIRTESGDDLIVLAGANDSLDALQAGPGAPGAQPVDFVKGGKGLKLIWAAFVLDRHQVQTWTTAAHRASVGFRFPLVKA